MKTATSLEGYKHTDVAKQKMVKRFEKKINHPFSFIFSMKKCWKHHDENTKGLISKPGCLNSRFGKKHTAQSLKKLKMSWKVKRLNILMV